MKAFHTPVLQLAHAGAQPSHPDFLPLWLSAPVDDLTKRLERLSQPDIYPYICQLPHHHHFMYNSCSHQKSCNALENCLCLRGIFLNDSTGTVLCDIYLCYCPFPLSSSAAWDEVLNAILQEEFGTLVIQCISQHIPSPSAWRKEACADVKHSVIADAHGQQASREEQWSVPVPRDVIFQCLKDYVRGSAWKTPPVCAVCSQYDMDAVEISVFGDLSSLHLDLL
ncbi:uncharacterized protein EDB91DRAFT_1255413 [Suillus paluster]|uniref:uncharacterized protein n=1 Tax=Suillus paluster TaxID=48578 RepID=UPI001B878073|nr:uncharacterized protein EDB91DRAFT_1255413 [Suillus paluster]KAG1724041.1 hypothetical protein EDB91DRAFT_1255413 [Suillus paluster]